MLLLRMQNQLQDQPAQFDALLQLQVLQPAMHACLPMKFQLLLAVWSSQLQLASGMRRRFVHEVLWSSRRSV